MFSAEKLRISVQEIFLVFFVANYAVLIFTDVIRDYCQFDFKTEQRSRVKSRTS